MAVITSLEHLPIDAVEYIVNNLTSSELSNCCAVSHVWRKIFANDIFWKNRFNKNITDYLKVAKCQVEPPFSLFRGKNATLQSVGSYREDYLRESHLWQNWRSGRFKREEIEFDCSISCYSEEVDFLDNDHVLLHRNSHTEVWDVSQEPNLVLEIPFNLKDKWDNCLYKVVSNRLVVVQCNVVQIFSISLESKTSNLDHVFFFNKSEEFSSSKLLDIKNIDKVFQEVFQETISFYSPDNIAIVICGSFLLGVITSDMRNPVIHVWDISNVKQLKEVVCPVLPQVPTDVILKAGKNSQDKVIVIFDNSYSRTIFVFLFDLKKLQFIEQSKVHLQTCQIELFDKYLCALSYSEQQLKVIDYDMNSKSLNKNTEPITLKTFPLEKTGYLRIFRNNVLVSINGEEILCIDPGPETNGDIKSIVKVDFGIGFFQVVQDKFLAIHDKVFSLKEIWEVGESSKKILSFPEDSGTYGTVNSGTYGTVNSACTRLVLERGNKLIILNFW